METLKSNPRVTYRKATIEDVIAATGAEPKNSLRAIAFFLDGKIAGLGGYKIENGSYVIFSDIKDNLDVSKQTIFRCAKVIMDFVKSKGVPMYVKAHNPELCERLGLQKFKEDIYKWQC